MAQDEEQLSGERLAAARARLAGKIHRTPVLESSALDAQHGLRLFFKCENFQKGGAFKARGATNAVFALSDAQARRGVATHSSGNHAAALARAAQLRGIRAYVVMPDNTPQAKRAAVARYGAEVRWCAPTLAAREQGARELLAQTGATLVHPYDDLEVMAGQASCAWELMEQAGELDALLCPVGGGGLIAGSACAARLQRPGLQVFGVEPAGADDAARSFRAGHIVSGGTPRTIADGLRGQVGVRPFAEIRRSVADIVTVGEEAIVRAMRELWEVLKIVVEPSAAVPYAALLQEPRALPLKRGQRVGIILTGGNLDLEQLPWQRGAA
jgi:threonine dehydratase